MNAAPYPSDTSAPDGRYSLSLPSSTHQFTHQLTGLSQYPAPANARIGIHQYPPQSSHTVQGSVGFHGKSTFIDSPQIDPALLGVQHGVDQHHPDSSFYLGPDRSSHDIQQNAMQDGLPQQAQVPIFTAEFADRIDVDAEFQALLDDLTHGTSDFSPVEHVHESTMSSNGLHSYFMTSKRESSQPETTASSEGNNRVNADLHRNGGKCEAPTPVSNIECMNANDNLSLSGAREAQVSNEAIGNAYLSSLGAKKRRRSENDDSSNSDSTDNHAESFCSTQLGQPQRKLAKMAKSMAISLTKDLATPQLSTSRPALKAQNPRLSAIQKLSRKESLIATDYSNVKISSDQLQGMTREEAQDKYIKRVALEIKGEDNVDEVKAEPEKWIRAIMDTFTAPYNETPEMKSYKAHNLPEFQRWQKEHFALTMEHLEQNKAQNLAEASATVLYHMIIDAHEKGALIESPGKSFGPETSMTCKTRLKRIISVLKALTIIRRDLVVGFRLVELVANPGRVLKRKEENKQENDKKQAFKKEKEEAAKVEGKVKAAKRGGKGKTAEIKSEEISTRGIGDEEEGMQEAKRNADRPESFARIDSFFPPGPTPVDDERFGDEDSELEEDEESLYD
jgi:hypothetical protein